MVANETKEVVQKEEQEAEKKALETQTIADDAQRDLNEAVPALVGVHFFIFRNVNECKKKNFLLPLVMILVS